MDYGNHSDEKRPLLTHSIQGSRGTKDDNGEPPRKHCCSTMTTKRKACYSVLLVLSLLLILTALLGIPYAMAAIYTWVIDKVSTTIQSVEAPLVSIHERFGLFYRGLCIWVCSVFMKLRTVCDILSSIPCKLN